LQCGAFEVDHVAIVLALQRQRDPVGSKQRPERGIGVVALGRDLDADPTAFVAITADEGEGGIAAAKFSRMGVNHAAACAMNGMKFNLV